MHKMKSLVLFGLLLAACVLMNVDAAPPGCPCAMVLIYLPVCGTDGQTYASSAVLNCEVKCTPGKRNLRVAHDGDC